MESSFEWKMNGALSLTILVFRIRRGHTNSSDLRTKQFEKWRAENNETENHVYAIALCASPK